MNAEDRQRARKFIAEDFSRSAKLYGRYAVPNTAPIAERLVQLASPTPGDRVLDVGTGTGPAAFLAARAVGASGRVLGIDIATGMITIARRKAAKLNLGNVRFEVMDAASLRLPDESFDVMLSNLGMPRLASDLPVALSEMFRVLRRGGKLCFSEYAQLSEAWKRLHGVLGKYKVANPGDAVAARRRLQALIEEEGKQFPLPDLSTLMTEAGFTSVRELPETFRAAYPGAQAYLEFFISREWPEYRALTPKAREGFAREAVAALGALETSAGLGEDRQVNTYLGSK